MLIIIYYFNHSRMMEMNKSAGRKTQTPISHTELRNKEITSSSTTPTKICLAHTRLRFSRHKASSKSSSSSLYKRLNRPDQEPRLVFTVPISARLTSTSASRSLWSASLVVIQCPAFEFNHQRLDDNHPMSNSL